LIGDFDRELELATRELPRLLRLVRARLNQAAVDKASLLLPPKTRNLKGFDGRGDERPLRCGVVESPNADVTCRKFTQFAEL
jgi:hypothetical protein